MLPSSEKTREIEAQCCTEKPQGTSNTALIRLFRDVFPVNDLATPFLIGRRQGAVADTGVCAEENKRHLKKIIHHTNTHNAGMRVHIIDLKMCGQTG